MRCVNCNGKTRVVNNAIRENGLRVWRRRECRACGERFTTDEVPRRRARDFRPGDRVRNRVSGDVGTVQKLANLQVGPGVEDDNRLYVIAFDRLGEMRDVSAKLTEEKLELVERADDEGEEADDG